MKKLSLLLVLALVFGMFHLTAQAATSGSCGTNITWKFNSSTKTLTITCNGEGKMNDYARFDSAPWYEHRLKINTVKMTGYITYIGKHNFYGITADFTLPDTIKRINSYGLAYCHFTSINMPALLETIDQSAFEFSVFEQPVVIPNGVQSIPYVAFQSCTFSSLTLPASLKSIGTQAFSMCRGLTEIELPEGMTSLGTNAFFNCVSLTEVTIPASLTSYSGTFGLCYKLEAIHVAPGNPILKDVDGVLFDIEGTILREYPAGKKDEIYTVPEGVTQLNASTFSGNKYLETIVLPSGLTTLPGSVFKGCTRLKHVDLPASITEIGGSAFYGCSELEHVGLPASLTEIGWSMFRECAALTEMTIPAGVTSIGDFAFYDSGLLRVTIPETVVDIGTNSFSNCPEDLTLCVIAGSAAYEYALENNKKLAFSSPFGRANLILPGGLAILDDEALAGTNAAVIKLPEGLTSIGSRAFADCPNLKHINLPESVASISPDAFSGCGTVYLNGTTGSIAETFAANCDNAVFIPLEP